MFHRRLLNPSSSDIFHGLAGHHLLDQHGRLVESFAPQLNELQQLVLDLLEIPHRIYTG
jgi:hypothetical protein